MWTLDGIRIFVEDVKPVDESIAAELNPIGETESTIHFFGAKSTKYTVAGVFVGLDTLDSIKSIVKSGNVVLLSGNKGFVKNVFVKDFRSTWTDVVYQTFDAAHACDDPVFKFSMGVIEQ